MLKPSTLPNMNPHHPNRLIGHFLTFHIILHPYLPHLFSQISIQHPLLFPSSNATLKPIYAQLPLPTISNLPKSSI
ncbi:hypothetical protein VIGAN_09047400 [Vigna angularis var. angularis]|uniref:Uncharacterized protein n=1 Tax=Vigna angularis var. angularis TaxID=157739 RepID=A0A0S3SWX3_PHAAN|nr:hypothetical protein VIGAN_09047400 [Vigna angularis var. angularis]